MTYRGVACYWLEPTETVEVGLRRYSRAGGCTAGYHQALTILGTAVLMHYWSRRALPAGTDHWFTLADGSNGVPDFAYPPPGDPAWPTECAEGCGYRFGPDDPWQRWSELLWRRADSGETTTLRAAAPGAMWDAPLLPWKGPDGRSLMAKCPNGSDWSIDARASNCTLPDDDEHRCWVRHGTPPNITVDKNGRTCAAGAGSIVAGDYHGFLRDGRFSDG